MSQHLSTTVACFLIVLPAAAQKLSDTGSKTVVSPTAACRRSASSPKQDDLIAGLSAPALGIGAPFGMAQSGSGCSPQSPPIPFTVEYRAYIPYDNATGNNTAACTIKNGTIYALYYGDSPGSTLPAGPPLTYRASIFSLVTPNSSVPVSLVTPSTGITYQFSMPSSPAKPPFLTAADYDGVLSDCYRENLQGQAGFPKNGSFSVSNSVSANSVTVAYSGTIADPLIPVSGLSVGWNFKTTVTLNPASQTATVTVGYGPLGGGVTCYPAHEVIVDGLTVASYVPLSNSVSYVGACLAGPAVFGLTGPATVTGGLSIPY